MNEEEKNIALPDDYTEQKCCGNCEFRETIYGDISCGDPDEYFCDFEQDYSVRNSWHDKRYQQWIKIREVKKCGICDNYKREDN